VTKRVQLFTRDLVFRAKLAATVRATGADVVGDEQCDLVVVELGSNGWEDLIRGFVLRRIAVLAFGSHVDPSALRAARELGARAVPNSEVESSLRALL